LAEANCGVNASKAGTRRGDTPDAKQTVALADYAGQNACQADGAGNECEEDYEDEDWDFSFGQRTRFLWAQNLPNVGVNQRRLERPANVHQFDGLGAFTGAGWCWRLRLAPRGRLCTSRRCPGLLEWLPPRLSGPRAGGPQERSVEVRQSIIMNVHGQRVLRKAVLVDGAVCYQDLKLVGS